VVIKWQCQSGGAKLGFRCVQWDLYKSKDDFSFENLVAHVYKDNYETPQFVMVMKDGSEFLTGTSDLKEAKTFALSKLVELGFSLVK
jgi:hypothetical protein